MNTPITDENEQYPKWFAVNVKVVKADIARQLEIRAQLSEKMVAFLLSDKGRTWFYWRCEHGEPITTEAIMKEVNFHEQKGTNSR